MSGSMVPKTGNDPLQPGAQARAGRGATQGGSTSATQGGSRSATQSGSNSATQGGSSSATLSGNNSATLSGSQTGTGKTTTTTNTNEGYKARGVRGRGPAWQAKKMRKAEEYAQKLRMNKEEHQAKNEQDANTDAQVNAVQEVQRLREKLR